MRTQTTLERILETDFNVDVATNYESIKRFLRHPDFPDREANFRQELARAIIYKTFSPEKVTRSHLINKI